MEEKRTPDPPQPQLTAQTGTHVAIELLDASGESERLEFDIVPDQMADLANGFLGEGTPLARAIANQSAGSSLPYRLADIVGVRILSVTPARSLPAADVAQQREAAIRKAVEEAQRTDAIVFASSFSGKWGDYNPEGMEHWDKTDS